MRVCDENSTDDFAKYVALPSVLSALKNHMFNDVIWPNLSDEDGGAGLLTYSRIGVLMANPEI
jgi:cAMP phosphodiesterase